jgi:hypothetical protein
MQNTLYAKPLNTPFCIGGAGKRMQNWKIGTEVTCPKCGQIGKVAKDTFRAKGRTYEYIVVRHYINGKVKRCVIAKSEAGPIPKQAEKGTEIGVPVVKGPNEGPKPPVFVDNVSIPEEVDKVSWYIVKVSASWGSFRENPNQENYNRFIGTVRQVSARINIPCEDVVAAADYFANVKSDKARTIVNEAVKRFIARIIIANTAHFAGEAIVEGPKVGPMEGAQVDINAIRDMVRAEIEKVVSEIKVPEITITKDDYVAIYSVFRQKKRTNGEIRNRAYIKWDQVFAKGRKVVNVE